MKANKSLSFVVQTLNSTITNLTEIYDKRLVQKLLDTKWFEQLLHKLLSKTESCYAGNWYTLESILKRTLHSKVKAAFKEYIQTDTSRYFEGSYLLKIHFGSQKNSDILTRTTISKNEYFKIDGEERALLHTHVEFRHACKMPIYEKPKADFAYDLLLTVLPIAIKENPAISIGCGYGNDIVKGDNRSYWRKVSFGVSIRYYIDFGRTLARKIRFQRFVITYLAFLLLALLIRNQNAYKVYTGNYLKGLNCDRIYYREFAVFRPIQLDFELQIGFFNEKRWT